MVRQIDALRDFAKSGRPIWGTCAGLIFLAEEADGACTLPPGSPMSISVA